MGSVYLDERRREFINLRQRQLTVDKYEKEFVRLSRYRKEIVPNEAERCKRIEEGLNDNIKIMITILGITDFTKLVEAAIEVEKVRISEQTRGERESRRGAWVSLAHLLHQERSSKVHLHRVQVNHKVSVSLRGPGHSSPLGKVNLHH